MTAREFYDWQTLGGATDVAALVHALETGGVSWCMIGGLAVNHWSEEPMATADVELVIAAGQVEDALAALKSVGFSESRHEWSINLKGKSKVSVQISTEPFYQEFPSRAVAADVHGLLMRVASAEDTLKGKLAAYADPPRRPSKRQKDLADIARLLEARPDLNPLIPAEVADRLEH